MMQDESERNGLEMIANYTKDIIEKQDCFDWKIRQNETDLIKLMTDATYAHDLLQKYALDISIDPVISGMILAVFVCVRLFRFFLFVCFFAVLAFILLVELECYRIAFWRPFQTNKTKT